MSIRKLTSFRSLAALTLGTSLILGVSLAACQPAQEDSVTADRSAPLQANEALQVSIEISGEVSKEQIHAIAQHVEQNGPGEIAGAQVAVNKTAGDEQGASIQVTLMGSNLGDGAGIADDLRGAFPVLADANIAVTEADPGANNMPMVHSDAEDPDEAAQEIIEQLKAQGIPEDAIHVEVSEDDEGHRKIEVKVHQEEVSEE